MSKYEVDFHVYGYHKDVGELIAAKDAESAIAAICVDIQIDDAILEKRIAELEAHNLGLTKTLVELENREKHLVQVIYNVSKVSFEAGACYQKSDFHNEAINFAKSMQAKQLKEQRDE